MHGLKPPRSRWEIPQKIMENKRAKILWDFKIQTDKEVLANCQSDIILINKDQKIAGMIDVAV